jgi:hypothetical protein
MPVINARPGSGLTTWVSFGVPPLKMNSRIGLFAVLNSATPTLMKRAPADIGNPMKSFANWLV